MRSRFVRGRWASLLVALLLCLGTAQAAFGWVELTDDMRALNTAIGTASYISWLFPPQGSGYLGDTLVSVLSLGTDLENRISAVLGVEWGIRSLVGSIEAPSSLFGSLATDIDAIESGLDALGTQLEASFAQLTTQIEGFGAQSGNLMRDLGSQVQGGMLALGTVFGSKSQALQQSLAAMGDATLAALAAASISLSSLSAPDALSGILDAVGGFNAIGTSFAKSLDGLLTAFEEIDGDLGESATDPGKLASIFNGLGELQLALAALPAESLLGQSEVQLDQYRAAMETLPSLLESLEQRVQGLSEPQDGFWEALRTFADGFPQWLESAPAAVEERLRGIAGSLTADIAQVLSLIPELDNVRAAVEASDQTLGGIQATVDQISGAVAAGFAQLDSLLGAAPGSSAAATAAVEDVALATRAAELRATLVALEAENARLRNANAALFGALRTEACAVLAASVKALPWQAFTVGTEIGEEVSDGSL